MTLSVDHEPENFRYVLSRDGRRIGVAAYRIVGNTIAFTHTEVDPEHRERGMAGRLVREALDDVRDSTSYRVQALCPYVASWIGDHPEYRDLLSR